MTISQFVQIPDAVTVINNDDTVWQADIFPLDYLILGSAYTTYEKTDITRDAHGRTYILYVPDERSKEIRHRCPECFEMNDSINCIFCTRCDASMIAGISK